MTKQIKRPETFAFDGIVYVDGVLSGINLKLGEFENDWSLFRLMPHDAFDALVESVLADIKSARRLRVYDPLTEHWVNIEMFQARTGDSTRCLLERLVV